MPSALRHLICICVDMPEDMLATLQAAEETSSVTVGPQYKDTQNNMFFHVVYLRPYITAVAKGTLQWHVDVKASVFSRDAIFYNFLFAK